MSNNLYRISKEALSIPCKEMADYLLGKKLVRKVDDGILTGRIVEIECYLGSDDKASQTYGGRRTARNEPMYMPAGTSFVYMTYGMYHCLNISSLEPGASVFIRALEPLEGLEHMTKLRLAKRRGKVKKLDKFHLELCNGPSKLCMSMNIEKNNCNKLDLCESDEMWLEEDPEYDDDFKVVRTGRIGIDSVGKEWATKPLRFYIFGNPHVSVRDKNAEKKFLDEDAK